MKIYEASCAARRLLNENPPPKEAELTRTFLRNLSKNHRIQSYCFSQNAEATIGADWLWLICTGKTMTAFLVQAKVLDQGKQEITSRQALYPSKSGEYQIDLLINQSRISGIPALYVLFSNKIRQVPCGSQQAETPEGVFVESATRIHHRFRVDKTGGLKHMPISCMFGCFSKKCNYYSENDLCKICLKCKKCRSKPYYHSIYHDTPCKAPFSGFMKDEMGLEVTDLPISDTLLPLLYCGSILAKHPEYILQSISSEFSRLSSIPQQIIITDYRNRHSEDYSRSIMGPDFEIDLNTIYKRSDIILKLKEIKRKYPIIKKIGLFGSYARQTEIHKTATSMSDIDLALRYTKSRFDEFGALAELGCFIREVFETFHKNIDFVDYDAARKCDHSKDFIEDIQEDLIWI